MFGLQIVKKERPLKVEKYPMEFSKKILVVSWVTGMMIIAYGLWLTYMMVIKGHVGDVSIVITILSGAFAEITAGTSFYFWKAKYENVEREKRKTLLETNGIEMEEEII